MIPLLSTITAISLVSCPLAAQQPDTLRTGPTTVVVEAFRTPLAIDSVPYAAAIVDARMNMLGRQGLGLDEALAAVPGVQVDNRFNYALGERISIRGFGARTQFGVRGVRVAIDGLPATFADGQSALETIDPSTLDRAEVVRGPASALYGNAAGGVLLLRSTPPPLETFRSDLGITLGGNGYSRYAIEGGGTVGDVGYLARFSRLDFDGYREHATAWRENIALQLRTRFGGGELRVGGNYVNFDALNPGALSDSTLKANPGSAFAGNIRQKTGKSGEQGDVGVSYSRSSGARRVELSGHGGRRTISNPIPGKIIDLDRIYAGVRAVASGDLSLFGRPIAWSIGTDLDAQLDDRFNFFNNDGERGKLTLDQYESVVGFGSFVQLVVPLTDSLRLMAALRYDATSFKAEDRFIDSTDPDDSGEREMDAFSPSAGISWTPLALFGLYANFATSFETPTTTELANRPEGAGGFNPDLQPQEAVSFELGMRGRSGFRLSYSLSAYLADIRNALISFQVPGADGRDFFRNAGTARHQGIEAAVEMLPVEGLRVGIAYSYTDARFRSYVVGDNSFDGNQVPGVAPHRFESQVSYLVPDLIFAGVTGRYLSSVAANDANSANTSSYLLLGLRAALPDVQVSVSDGGWDLHLAPFAGIDNLLDERYVTSVTVNAFGGRYFEPGPGRTLYAGIKVGVGLE